MSGIILGPGLIGEAASKKAQATAVDETGGGAIQVGPGLLSKKKFGKAREAEQAAIRTGQAAAVEPVVPTLPPLAPLPPLPEVDLGEPPVAPEPVAAADATAAVGLSEDDAEVMLATDPNSWDIVAEAESQRAEGWRPRVARMLLNAAKEAKLKPMPEEAVAHLTRIAEVGAVSEASKLAAAVGAAETIGTGNPEAAPSN